MDWTHDDLWFCEDCTLLECNGQNDALTDAQLQDIQAMRIRLVEEVGPNIVPNFNLGADEDCGYSDFTHRHCDCCRSSLYGARYRFAALGEG